MDEDENNVEDEVVDESPPPETKPKKKRKKSKKPKLDADPVAASMMDRVDAWKCAEKLLHEAKWGTGDDEEIVIILPSSVLDLANWILYGPAVMTYTDDEDD